MSKQDKKLWWGWLVWVPISIALGFYGTTLQGGRYNINQVVYLLVVPVLLIVSAVRQKQGKKTHFWKMLLIAFAAVVALGIIIALF